MDINQFKSLSEAFEVTGHGKSLGKPSKMPGFSTSLPAMACKTGARLRKVKGSVCEKCYAFRGNYGTPSVQKGLSRRLAALSDSRWAPAMARLISHYTKSEDPYFRIHDSGDFQSVEHVLRWVSIARCLPWVKFWAPSKEYGMARTARKQVKAAGRDWPDNLVIRLSAPMIGQAGLNRWRQDGTLYSTVDSGSGHECPAPTQDNECGPCRACWDRSVQSVDYHRH